MGCRVSSFGFRVPVLVGFGYWFRLYGFGVSGLWFSAWERGSRCRVWDLGLRALWLLWFSLQKGQGYSSFEFKFKRLEFRL